MSESAAAAPGGEVDDTITASVRALQGWHRVKVIEMAHGARMTKPTLERRLRNGGYTTQEAVNLARYFGVPAADLLAGTINLAASHVSAQPMRPKPTPKRANGGRRQLPRVDSNHQPAGYSPYPEHPARRHRASRTLSAPPNPDGVRRRAHKSMNKDNSSCGGLSNAA